MKIRPVSAELFRADGQNWKLRKWGIQIEGIGNNSFFEPKMTNFEWKY
jgi:hypothetical protein